MRADSGADLLETIPKDQRTMLMVHLTEINPDVVHTVSEWADLLMQRGVCVGGGPAPEWLAALVTEVRRLREALTHVADEIRAQRTTTFARWDLHKRAYWNQLEGVAREALGSPAPGPTPPTTEEKMTREEIIANLREKEFSQSDHGWEVRSLAWLLDQADGLARAVEKLAHEHEGLCRAHQECSTVRLCLSMVDGYRGPTPQTQEDK